jgi:hypothetical protein
VEKITKEFQLMQNNTFPWYKQTHSRRNLLQRLRFLLHFCTYDLLPTVTAGIQSPCCLNMSHMQQFSVVFNISKLCYYCHHFLESCETEDIPLVIYQTNQNFENKFYPFNFILSKESGIEKFCLKFTTWYHEVMEKRQPEFCVNSYSFRR